MPEKKIDIKSLIAGAKRPERTVTLNLRGDLIAEVSELEDQLRELQQQSDTRLVDNPDAIEIAQRIQELEAEAEGSELTIRLQAVPRSAWRSAIANNPDPDGERIADLDGVAREVLGASILSPDIDEDDLEALTDALSAGQWGEIVGAVWTLNSGDNKVPFSRLASLTVPSSGDEPQQPETGESASDDSTDGNPESGSPSKTETKKASRLAG